MFKKQQLLRRLTVPIIAWGLVLSTLTPSVGWTESPLKKAQALAFEAQISAEKSDFKQSIRLYQKAYELYPEQEFLFAVASLYRRVSGSCKEELKSWEIFFSHCKSCARLDEAKKRLTDSRTRCSASLTVTCQPSSALVSLNNIVKGRSPQTMRALSAGRYNVQCGVGEEKVTRAVRLQYGQHKNLSLSQDPAALPLRRQLPPPSSQSATSVQGAHSETSSVAYRETSLQLTPLEWGLVGGGVATLSVGAYLLLHQLPSKIEQRDAQGVALMNADLASSQEVVARAQELDQEAQSAETWGLVSLGASAALLGSALYMMWPERAVTAHIQYVPAESARVSLQWSW